MFGGLYWCWCVSRPTPPYNAFNHQNLGNPNTNISSGVAFGRITAPLNVGYGTGTARQMQFMVRVNY